jgi:arylsulfatase A-like enzyme
VNVSPPSPRDEPLSIPRTALIGAVVGLGELVWVHRLEGPFANGSPWLGALAVALVYGLLGALVAGTAALLARAGVAVLGRSAAELPLALVLPLGAHLLGREWSHWNSASVRALELAAVAVLCLVIAALLTPLLRPLRRLSSGVLWAAVLVLAGLYLAFQPQVARQGRASAARASGPSALLVTIDTLRADGIGAYGHAAARTPTIDRLAAEGVLFETAITHSVLTGPSHATILSGLLPMEHGVIENAQRLPHDVPTLGELLAQEGWATAAFVSGFPVTNRASGLPGRFDRWDDDLRRERALPQLLWSLTVGRLLQSVMEARGAIPLPNWRGAELTSASAVAWLERGRGPFFAWLHYFDPHLPYEPPADLVSAEAQGFAGPRGETWYKLAPDERARIIGDPAAVARMRELYDAEIANVDRQLARVIAAARARAGDDLWIIVTADHGESFGEHGIWYRRELYDDSLRVPLIIAPPPGGPRGVRIAEQVRLSDLARTILEALGARSAVGGQGVSLLGLARAGGGSSPGPAISAIFLSRADPHQRSLLSVREGGSKAIWRAEGWANSDALWAPEGRELYDLGADPAELDDLAAERPEDWQRLRDLASHMQLELRTTESLDPEDLEALHALGYTP